MRRQRTRELRRPGDGVDVPPADQHFERIEADLADEIRERFCASVEQHMVSKEALITNGAKR